MTAPIAHSERTHALLSPSSAARWTTCTASVGFIEANRDRIPPERSSKYADEGTLAHEVADAILTGKPLPAGVNKDMIRYGEDYAEFVKSLTAGVVGDSSTAIEKKCPLWYAPEKPYGGNGHVDCLIKINEVTGNEILHVVDYKYGAGIPVDAEGNIQMAIYALAAIYSEYPNMSATSKVALHIYQPRCRKGDDEGPDSSWYTTLDALNLLGASQVEHPAEIIMNPELAHLRKFAPSEKACRFCPARSICTAHSNELLAIEGFAPIFEVVSAEADFAPTDITTLTDQQASQVFHWAPAMIKWLESSKEYAQARADAGNPLPDTKLVEGRGARDWTDEEAAAKLLSNHLKADEVFKREINSVAQIEKKLKGKELSSRFTNALDKLIKRIKGEPVVAPESDKRPAVKSEFEEDFTSLLD